MKVTKEQLSTLQSLLPPLKKTIRYGVREKDFHQTVFDHINNMLRLAPQVIKKCGLNFDIDLVNALIMVHDLPETGMAYDITAIEQATIPGKVQEKKQIEERKMQQFSEIHGKWLLELHNVYTERCIDEAKFVKFLDVFEADIHCLLKLEKLKPSSFGFKRTKKVIDDFPAVKKYLTEWIQQYKPRLEKAGLWDTYFDISP